MAGAWTALTNQPTFSANHMMLLTDGTVMVQEVATSNWWRLTPDAFGSYVNGTWSSRATGPNGPTYFASVVLRDGRVFMSGGEDNFGNNGVDIVDTEIYDPVADSWTTIASPPGWSNVGDAPCCLLPDGTVLLGSIVDTKTAIYDPVAAAWTAGPAKDDSSSEETWTLLPDETVLVAECNNHPKAEKYVAAAGRWVSAGSVPAANDLVQSSIGSSNEVGPAILMPDGTVFAIGASGHTAIYTMPPIANQPGAWSGGPNFPTDPNGLLMRAFDAPAALLPNGKVLCIAGQVLNDGWAGNPSQAFEFDGTSLMQVPDPPNGASVETWQMRFLLLPTGEVLASNRGNDIRVYQPDGAPDPSWGPSITSAPTSVRPNTTYTIKGRQLNGLSQANSYGDDATMATNFPLVKITNNLSGHVFYCRTHDFSTMGVATGNVVHSAEFTVPAGIELGPSSLCVIANGIASCTAVLVTHEIKIWKEIKFELKENFKVERDIAVKSVLAVAANAATRLPEAQPVTSCSSVRRKPTFQTSSVGSPAIVVPKPTVGLIRWSIRPIHSTPRLLIGKVGKHLVNRLIVVCERVLHILDYLSQWNRRAGFGQIQAGSMHDTRGVREAHHREGNFGCPQLRSSVLSKLRHERAISGGGPEFAHSEQDPIGLREFR